MKRLLRRLLGSRVGAGTAVGVAGMGMLIATQLIAVPVMARSWGLAAYGSWLVLFTLPSLLAQGDLGLSLAGGTIMIDAVARGEGQRAAAVLSALRLVTLTVGCLALVATLGYVLVLAPHTLDFAQRLAGGHGLFLLVLLTLYGMVSLQSSVTIAALRAADDYAGGLMWYQLITVGESLLALTVVALGGGALAAAGCYLLVRTAGTVLLSLRLRVRAPWSRDAALRADRATLRELAPAALASFTLPLANATIYQGAVLVIGAACGAAAVPAFTAIRTLSRTAMSVLLRLNFASQPRYTVATATGDGAARGLLLVLNLAIAPLALPWVLVLGLFGALIVRVWTHGAVVADGPLLWLMGAIALANALWMPLSNLVVALNRQGRFSYFYLGSALAALAVGNWAARGLAPVAGVRRIALALLGQEVAMLVWVVAVSASLGILARSELRAGLAGLRALLHRPS